MAGTTKLWPVATSILRKGQEKGVFPAKGCISLNPWKTLPFSVPEDFSREEI